MDERFQNQRQKSNSVYSRLEVTFAGLRNYTKSRLFSGRHRVKLMMADLLLVSGLSTSRLRNSFNFLISYGSGVVVIPIF